MESLSGGMARYGKTLAGQQFNMTTAIQNTPDKVKFRHDVLTVEQGLNIMKKQLEKKNIKSQARLHAFQSSMNQFKKHRLI